MTKSFRLLRSKIGVAFLALMLLLAQQMALAHMVGHLGDSCRTLTQSAPASNDADSDTTPSQSLSHLCSACIAFTGLCQSAVSQVPSLTLDPQTLPLPVISFEADVRHTTPWRQLPRGPPIIL